MVHGPHHIHISIITDDLDVYICVVTRVCAYKNIQRQKERCGSLQTINMFTDDDPDGFLVDDITQDVTDASYKNRKCLF